VDRSRAFHAGTSPNSQQVTQPVLAIGRRVHASSGLRIAESGTRDAADLHLRTLDDAANPHGSLPRQRPLRERLKAVMQGRSVSQRLLGRRIGRAFVRNGMAKQRVCRGDDILDLGACLRLEHRNHIDQHAGVRDEAGRLLQRGKLGARFDARLEDCLGLHLHLGRQLGQRVEGRFGRPPAHMSTLLPFIDIFRQTVDSDDMGMDQRIVPELAFWRPVLVCSPKAGGGC
jgi:hypothetical protein